MPDVKRVTRLLIGGMIVALGLTLWAAGRANANCPANDPNCMGGGGGMSNSTSPQGGGTPPVTNNQHSSSGGSQPTQPPVLRTTPATRHTPATRRQIAQTPATAPAEAFVPAPAGPAVVQPGPAIALSGTAPPGGLGTAAASGRPPAPPSDSGATTVLWAFGIGAGLVGIGVGAAATLKPRVSVA